MSAGCTIAGPHNPHLAAGPTGLCPGVPRPEDLDRAKGMVREAWDRAAARCLASCRPCVDCVGGQLLDLHVFTPVLFPEEKTP
jgi:hypothetical protein